MKNITQAIISSLISCFMVFSPVTAIRPVYGAEEPAPTPPWTQEKAKPKEVEDKEKKDDRPIGWCTKTRKDGTNVTTVTYADGTEVKYIPGVSWVVTIPDGKGNKTTVIYDPKNLTKTTVEPGKQPVTEKWLEAAKLATTPTSATPTTPSTPPPPAKSDTTTKPNPTKEDKPQNQTNTTTQRVPTNINTKLVTYGGPMPGITVHFEPESPNTPNPNDFAKTDKPQNTWTDDDKPGPSTTPGPIPGGNIPIPGPGGKPVTPGPGGGPGTTGGWVNIGSGWSFVRVPYSFIEECSNDDAGQTDGTRSAQAPAPAGERRRTIEQQQADEWDAATPPPKSTYDGGYNPTGEGDYIKGVREDAARFRKEIAQHTQERYDSCWPDWAWDWSEGNPIWKAEGYLMRRQWMIEIYEEAYRHARSQGSDNLVAHARAQIKLDEWRQEAVDQFVSTMIEHLQNLQGAISGVEAMRAAAQYADEFLRAKDVIQRRAIFEKAIKQAKARGTAPASPRGQTPARTPRNPELARGGVRPALPPKEENSASTSSRTTTPREEATERYSIDDGPAASRPKTNQSPKPNQCPPTNRTKAQELAKLEAKIDAKAKRTDEIAGKLTRNRFGEEDPDWFKENPGDRLTRQQRDNLEKEFDKLMGENIKDLSTAIQVRNELYPRAEGKSSITPAEAQALLSGKKPLMGTDRVATPESESPTQRFGPGGTQQLPRTGPGQTQPLRGPGDTQKLENVPNTR